MTIAVHPIRITEERASDPTPESASRVHSINKMDL